MMMGGERNGSKRYLKDGNVGITEDGYVRTVPMHMGK